MMCILAVNSGVENDTMTDVSHAISDVQYSCL